MPEEDTPLASAPAEPVGDEEEDEDDEEPTPETPRPRPPVPTFSYSWTTFVYVFLGLMGILMLFDTTTRNQFAGALGDVPTATWFAGTPGPLYALIGFGSNYLLLTMALAGAIEMLITSLAYNFTTDWIQAAKVQKWSAAFRKVQMEAIRSGKKDRIAALKPHQERLARMSASVSIGQFKGMAITYFLIILIYSWVGLVISKASSTAQTLVLNGSTLHLTGHVVPSPAIPWWFLIFSLYTIPSSLVFRRLLKHWWLRRYLAEHPAVPGSPASGPTGGTA